MKYLISLFLFLLGCAHAASFSQDNASSTILPLHTILLGKKELTVELATTKSEYEKGLMFRSHLPKNFGMLFVFKEPAIQCFWMKNTLTTHCSDIPVSYVLEVPTPWIKAQTISLNTHVKYLPTLPLQ